MCLAHLETHELQSGLILQDTGEPVRGLCASHLLPVAPKTAISMNRGLVLIPRMASLLTVPIAESSEGAALRHQLQP